ncbi:MAG: UPF0149 family protein [Pseudomonadales bacterium]|jgi:uncharacterized protein YgfB (UPF0149 family)|nr:UPF0149 family protein [Pseudomonadales bacterium]
MVNKWLIRERFLGGCTQGFSAAPAFALASAGWAACYDSRSSVTAVLSVMQVDYTLTAQLLADSLPGIAPAALHGLLSGQLCSGVVQPDPQDLAELLAQELLPVVRKLLERLAQQANAQLGGLDYAFQPLLPDDDVALSARVYALGLWCEAFTTGFAAGYLRPDSALSREAREILHDFGELACLTESQSQVDEQDEEDFMELVEYVRMAAITLYQQLVGTRAPADDAPAEPPPPYLLH